MNDDPRYRAYGLTLAIDFPLIARLPRSSASPDLEVRRIEEPAVTGWEGRTPEFSSPFKREDGTSGILLHRLPEVDVFRCADVADFYVWDDRVDCLSHDPALDFALELYLLGLVLAYWLERRGSPMLHASAVAVVDRGVGFLATNRAGKSSLAASLMQAGHPLLTDDLLRLDVGSAVVAHPGYPQMRMWPEEAEHFVGNVEDLGFVHPELTKRRVPVGPPEFGEFCDGPRPLARLYLPTRRDPSDPETRIVIRPVPRGRALIELVRGSFLPRVTEAAGLQAERLARLTALAAEVPMRELVYPDGLARLPRVKDAILADLNGSRPVDA